MLISGSQLRLFFAIDLTDEIRNKLAVLIEEFKYQTWGHKIHWVPPENLHLTLRFIGPCKTEQVAQLIQNAQESILANTAVIPFSLQLKSVQLFPTSARPRIISVSFHPTPELFQLAFTVEQAVVASGFTPETRPYLPHLTLGRIVQHKKISLDKWPSLTEYSLPVDQIYLLNSEEQHGRRIYEILQKINL